jgi:hypothetical protein
MVDLFDVDKTMEAKGVVRVRMDNDHCGGAAILKRGH